MRDQVSQRSDGNTSRNLSETDIELLRAAQERIDARKKLTSTRLPDNQEKQDYQEYKESPAGDLSTSTREPGLSENQDFQESQDRQVLQESPRGDAPSAAAKEESYGNLFASGNYAAIPDHEFLRLAWEESESEGKNWQEDGVSETWEFCRYLLAHPNFKELGRAALVKKLRKLTDLEDDILETILAEIARVRFAKGGGPLDWAIGMAAQYPLTDPEDLGLDRYNRFLSIAGWLQVMRGDNPVYLPVEKLAQILSVTPRAVSTWRSIAQRQGLLTEVAGYEPHKRATEFRFAVERFGVLRERRSL